MTKAERILSLIDNEIIGIEIEDTRKYCDEIEILLKRHNIPYSYGGENTSIYEIRFHLPYKKMIELLPDFTKNFTLSHPKGCFDRKAGCMHVHFDVGTIFFPTSEEVRENCDIKFLQKQYQIVRELLPYCKRNLTFRDSMQKTQNRGSAHGSIRLDDFSKFIMTDRYLLEYPISSSFHMFASGKWHPICFNKGEGKPITWEIRTNEIFPVWIPLYLLMSLGYDEDDALRAMRLARPNDISTKYCVGIYEDVGVKNNIKFLKELIE